MKNPSIYHEPHEFVTLHESIYNSITIRQSNKDAQTSHKLTTEVVPPLKVKTLYTYDYRNPQDGRIGYIESDEPLKSKWQGSNPTRIEIPLIERRCTIRTSLKTEKPLSRSELEVLDTEDGVVEVTVNSPMILQALRAVVDYFPGYSLWEGQLKSMRYPYFLITHHRERLREYKTQHPSGDDLDHVKECNLHIDELLSFMDRELEKPLEYEKRWAEGELMISFNMLWLLFKHGLELYAHDGDHLDPYICQWCDYPTDKVDEYKITAWNIDFDGSTLGRSRRDFHIKRFLGDKKITALSVFPSKFYDRKLGENFRTQRIESGKKFCNISKMPSYMEYTGTTLNTPRQKVCLFYLQGRLSKHLLLLAARWWNKVISAYSTVPMLTGTYLVDGCEVHVLTPLRKATILMTLIV